MALLRKLAYLGAAMSFQWSSLEKIRALQLKKLRAMLAHCEARVPLYRESFKAAGIGAGDLQCLEDLRHFPTLTREEVTAAYPDRCLSRPTTDRDRVFRTSGTSGLFMNIAYSENGNDFLDAVYARALFNTGYRPWHRIAYYWWEDKETKLYEKLGIMRKAVYKVGPDPRVHLEELRALKPRVIYNFPSLMLMLARLVEAEGHGGLQPEIIICHGELMPSETRAEIARIFQCPVWNQYGAQEFNRMGWNCAANQGLHLDADSVILEVLDAEGPADNRETPIEDGEEGELVFTGLQNTLMPLIRYRIGDLGRKLITPCTCGRGLPLFEVTEGRRDDLITLPDGRSIGPRAIAPRVEEIRGFHQYRIVEHEPGRLAVSLVLDAQAEHDTLRKVEQALRALMGDDMEIKIEAVAEIPLSRRGKLRKVVSEVSKPAVGP